MERGEFTLRHLACLCRNNLILITNEGKKGSLGAHTTILLRHIYQRACTHNKTEKLLLFTCTIIYNLATVFSKTGCNTFPHFFVLPPWGRPIDDTMIDKWLGHYHDDKKSFAYLGQEFCQEWHQENVKNITEGLRSHCSCNQRGKQ